jgi:Fur family ferric uptake transcriptional regulator
MASNTEVINTLRDQGYRLTPQRMLILSVVAEGDGHLGVDEVFRRAKESYEYMDIATVYRTLHLLKGLGVVTEVAIDDRLHYELTDPTGPHHHMVCKDCNGAFNLNPGHLEEFQNTLLQRFGFEPDLEHFTVTGRCSECRSQDTKKSAGS